MAVKPAEHRNRSRSEEPGDRSIEHKEGEYDLHAREVQEEVRAPPAHHTVDDLGVWLVGSDARKCGSGLPTFVFIAYTEILPPADRILVQTRHTDAIMLYVYAYAHNETSSQVRMLMGKAAQVYNSRRGVKTKDGIPTG